MKRRAASRHESSPDCSPPLPEQQAFWNSWNARWRFGEADAFMQREREVVLEVARGARLRDARILDVGCGTGWLGQELLRFGHVVGTDLSSAAIAEGARRYPGLDLRCGDFLALELPGPFDFVLAADALANMHEPARCVDRMASLLRPGGTLLLVTPNRAVWLRRSTVKPLQAGQVQRWPSLARCRELLAPAFEVERIGSIEPGGDRGLLWWVENRYVRGLMRRVVGRHRWRSLLEGLRLGRSLVLVARRR